MSGGDLIVGKMCGMMEGVFISGKQFLARPQSCKWNSKILRD